MASPNRIEILRILNAKGSVTYSELKEAAGFRTKKESGKFAYHLRKLLSQSLVSVNKSERRYTITNLGKLVLSLARQVEERSVIEGGKMYVRTSDESIEEFNSHKIMRSLVSEGGIPLEMAQKITEEVENRIYKYQTSYLTGAIIREMVNYVLLEHGQEEYRRKLARLGLPVFDIHNMLTNLDIADNGTEGLLFDAGQRVFAEYLLSDTLPKDITDAHLVGDLHINNPGTWSMIPDTIFVNIKELLGNGIVLGGKYVDVSRIQPLKQLDTIISTLSILISLLSKEASQEIVLDDMPQIFTKHTKPIQELEEKLTQMFSTISTTSKYNKQGSHISIRLHIGTDTKTTNAIINAYKNYTKITPIPRIGLIINYEKDKISHISEIIAEIISIGGKVMFTKDNVSNNGIVNKSTKNTGPLSIMLQSMSINLPRLALESSKDEAYFRARLVLLLSPALAVMELRKKSIVDLTRRGLNPILAKNTQFMQRSSISLVINLVGLNEAVFNILGFKNDKGREILYKVIETTVSSVAKKSKEMGEPITVSMVEAEGAARFTRLDEEKYGKNSVLNTMEGDFYSQGIVLDSTKLDDYSNKSEPILGYNKLFKLFNGGLLAVLNIDKNADIKAIKTCIEKTASLVPSFRVVKIVPICGECGFKNVSIEDKCPKCESPYIL